jgi:anti-sigma B factor antagonist
MRTAVGVFTDRDRAEEAIRKLIEHRVPPERITFLTRSASEASSVGKQLQDVGDPLRGSEGPARFNVLSITGIGSVLTQGPDVKDLFDQAVTENDAASAAASLNNPGRIASAASVQEDDSAFFRRVLNEGCSVVVVRSDSNLVATAACEVLDRLSLGIRRTAAPKSGVTVRQIPGATVAHFSGKLALDDGCRLLRETIRAFLDSGQQRILLSLERVDFLDSAGLGELVRSHVAVRSRGGHLTLINPAPGVRQLLRVTKVDQVFDIAPDELTALNRIPKLDR